MGMNFRSALLFSLLLAAPLLSSSATSRRITSNLIRRLSRQEALTVLAEDDNRRAAVISCPYAQFPAPGGCENCKMICEKDAKADLCVSMCPGARMFVATLRAVAYYYVDDASFCCWLCLF